MDDTSRSHQSAVSEFSLLQSCRSDDEMPGLVTPVFDQLQLVDSKSALIARQRIGLEYLIHKRQLDLARMNKWIIENNAQSQRQEMYRAMESHIPFLLKNLEVLYHLAQQDTGLEAEKKEIGQYELRQRLYKDCEAYKIAQAGDKAFLIEHKRKREKDDFCGIE